ncbi:peptide chain release factor N(5)-glutamine methyltransferase [bacterium]|nr:peptide chain release factor N(5)-glutamine methyltransferase [bacterium]
MMNRREAITALTARLTAAGVSTPLVEAELFLCNHLKLARHELYLSPAEPIDPEIEQRLLGDVERRCQREPLQYILGETDFYGLTFTVRPGVLIPRPETELLVEWAIELLPSGTELVYDVCCGSGYIACALAYSNQKLRVVATDISADAVELTRHNVGCLGLEERITVRQGDLDEGLTESVGLLCCNPPYISAGELSSLESEVARHEPHLALGGGEDGLDFYRRIFPRLPVLLKPGGWAVFEIGDGRFSALAELAGAVSGLGKAHLRRDLSQRERLLALQRD